MIPARIEILPGGLKYRSRKRTVSKRSTGLKEEYLSWSVGVWLAEMDDCRDTENDDIEYVRPYNITDGNISLSG